MSKDENKKIKKENKNGFKNLKLELKKVVWPTPKQLANNTIAVITIVLITAIIVFGLDFAFEKANEYGVEKLKANVKSNNETNSEVVENVENGENGENNESEEENKEGATSENKTEESSQNNETTSNQTVDANSEEQNAEN